MERTDIRSRDFGASELIMTICGSTLAYFHFTSGSTVPGEIIKDISNPDSNSDTSTDILSSTMSQAFCLGISFTFSLSLSSLLGLCEVETVVSIL